MRIKKPAVTYVKQLAKMIEVRQTLGAEYKARLLFPGKNWMIMIIHETKEMEPRASRNES